MNTANLMAWLTCLILAFFACILSVRNAVTTLQVEKRMAQMEQRLDATSGQPLASLAGQIAGIRRSLDNIAAELETLQQAPDASAELQAKLAELHSLVRDLQLQLPPPPRGEEP